MSHGPPNRTPASPAPSRPPPLPSPPLPRQPAPRPAPTEIHAILPPKGRALRLDFFRGIANWAIFLDHIPDNVATWVTTRNYGFSDAADLFVFISGYTASFVYAKMMLERGFIVGATRLTKRVWQLYVAHVILFVIYIAAIGYVAQRYNDPDIINEFNVAGLVDNPIQTLTQGLLLKFKPLNLDVLPLYIVLMGFFPPVLWMMLRKPDLTMLASLALGVAARQFGGNLQAIPAGAGKSIPLCWRVLVRVGGWVGRSGFPPCVFWLPSGVRPVRGGRSCGWGLWLGPRLGRWSWSRLRLGLAGPGRRRGPWCGGRIRPRGPDPACSAA